MPPILIFANPISGRGRGRILADKLLGRLQAIGHDVRLFLDPPAAIPAADLPLDPSAAVIIGGDGTLRAVARRLFGSAEQNASDAPAASTILHPPLLLVPMGTANLMGQHLGLRWPKTHAEDHIAAALHRHDLISMDVATANHEFFLLMVGVGIDGHVVHELERVRNGPITKASYAWPIFSAFTTYPFPPLRVTLDGRVVHDTAPAVAFVANISEYGAGFPILPHARGDDGLLDVCVLPCRSHSQAVGHLLAAAAGEHVHGPGVVYARGRHVRIDSPLAAPAQVDGEAIGHTPVEIRLLAAKIRFIVPVGP